MARFNYQVFDEQYNTLAKLTGVNSDNTEADTIVGVINNSDSNIKSRLEYAEGALWASSKLEAWDETVTNLKTNLANLEDLLKAAKAARDAYEAWEQTQTR